jgi:hypothetical protein
MPQNTEETERLLTTVAGDKRLNLDKRSAVKAAIEIVRRARVTVDNQIKSWRSAIPYKGVVIILGFRGQGKSALAWYIMEMCRTFKGKPRPVYVLGMPKAKRRYAPRWVKHVEGFKNIPKHAVILVDEAALRFPARRSQSDENIAVAGLNALSRQRDQLIIFVAHTARLLELEAIMDCNVIIYRKPSASYLKFERRETMEWTTTAREQIMSKGNPLHWAYVIDLEDDRRGLLRCRLPSFWSDELSKAWADLDVDALIKAMKGEKHSKGDK